MNGLQHGNGAGNIETFIFYVQYGLDDNTISSKILFNNNRQLFRTALIEKSEAPGELLMNCISIKSAVESKTEIRPVDASLSRLRWNPSWVRRNSKGKIGLFDISIRKYIIEKKKK